MTPVGTYLDGRVTVRRSTVIMLVLAVLADIVPRHGALIFLHLAMVSTTIVLALRAMVRP